MPAAVDRDVRVGDYLDDQLQTLADFNALDHLLKTARERHGLLRQQLTDAQNDLQLAQRASQQHESAMQNIADGFSKQQGDIDRRIMIITGSEASEDAVRKLEPVMEKLRRLDVAAGYVQLLADVDKLGQQCREKLASSDDAALNAYRQLETLVLHLASLQEAAEGAAPHLVDHVSATARSCHEQIKATFSSRMEDVLKKIQWPRANAGIPVSIKEVWFSVVGSLLELQKPDLEARTSAAANRNERKGPVVLFPFQVLVKPLEMRFKYHFDGDRPTNRIDKPEYFLQHVEDLLNTYNDFVVEEIQPILLGEFRTTDIAFNPVYIDATSALITALLPMVRAKVFAILPAIAAQPQLLSHLMHELMQFDSRIRDDWGYSGGFGGGGWKGLAWEVLVQQDWFGRWLQVENDFALQRYQDILDAPDSGELDFDSVDPSSTKPTKAAIRVNDLLETITDRYRPLMSFPQKLRFLIDIQISIFDLFHERLHSSLEAYLTMTSTIGRRVQGISSEEQASLQGIAGLDRLCRVYGSADYLERAMRDWSDDIFFLELFDTLQHRVRSRAPGDSGDNLAGPLSIADVAERTSSTIGPNSTSDADSGALFDETASSYNRLRVRSEGIIIDVLNQNIRDIMRAYRNINPWASLTTPQTNGPASTTAELDLLITYLNSSFTFLAKALAQVTLHRIVRSICQNLDAIFFDQVLLRRTFSSSGAFQLSADLQVTVRTLEQYVSGSVVRRGLKRAAEGIRLVSLPVRPGDGDEEAEEVQAEKKWGLWEVEKRVFASNESARAVLEEMGCEILSEQEARSVMEKRVELSS